MKDLEQMSDEELMAIAQGGQEPSGSMDLESMSDEELRQLAKSEGLIERTSTLESVARGSAEGLTLGFSSEIAAGIESIFTDKTYEEAKLESELAHKEAQADNPIAYGAADIAGSVVGGLALPGGFAAKTAGNVALGAISGAGRAEEGERLEGAAIGGAFGYAGDLAGKALGSLVGKAGKSISKTLSTKQKSQVLEAGLGGGATPTKIGKFRSIIRKSGSNENDVVDYILQAKHGVDDVAEQFAGKPVVQGLSIDETFDSVQTHIHGEGRRIGETIDALEEVIDKTTGLPIKYSREQVLEAATRRMNKNVWNSPLDGVTTTQMEWNKEAFDEIEKRISKEGITPGALFKLVSQEKSSLYSRAKDVSKDGKVGTLKTAYQGLKEFLDADVSLRLKDKAPIYKEANKAYAAGMTFLEALEGDIGKDVGLQGMVKRSLNLRSMIVGSSAFMWTGSPVAAMALIGTVNELIDSPTIALKLAQAANSSTVSNLINKINIGDKAAKMAGQKMVAAASRSEPIFNLVAQQEVNKFALREQPITRNTEEAWARAHQVIPVVQAMDYNLAQELRKAVEHDDKEMYKGILHGLSGHQQASKYIEGGIGWDGMAVTPEEKQAVSEQIQNSNLPFSARLKILNRFKQDNMIPDLSMIEGRITNSTREEALKPRNAGRKVENY